MKRFRRIFFLLLDACGVGALPDASDYGDSGTATLPNTAAAAGGLSLPCLERLGLGNIAPIQGVRPASPSLAAFGKMAASSPGKDSTAGHWEHFGVILDRPFPLYPSGFPEEVIAEFRRRSGYDVIGNVPASGTEIIGRLGDAHLKTGALIVYTSADSVFQIAAHENMIPREELYRICRLAREMLQGRHSVGRVIARPFDGKSGNYVRTAGRKDFSIQPPSPLVTEELTGKGLPVTAIGKIYDIMAGRGITEMVTASGNFDCMDKTIRAAKNIPLGLIMVNFVDFDMLWGHRNDWFAFARGLEEFDLWLTGFLDLLSKNDLLIITADHGCDPTDLSTDHTREYVPLLAYFPGLRPNIDLGLRRSFADTGKTIAANFGVDYPFPGQSFLHELK